MVLPTLHQKLLYTLTLLLRWCGNASRDYMFIPAGHNFIFISGLVYELGYEVRYYFAPIDLSAEVVFTDLLFAVRGCRCDVTNVKEIKKIRRLVKIENIENSWTTQGILNSSIKHSSHFKRIFIRHDINGIMNQGFRMSLIDLCITIWIFKF